MSGCGFPGGCDDTTYYLCTVIARIAEPIACGRTTLDQKECSLVAGHPSWVACRGARAAKVDTSTRDGEAERKGGENPAFKKRHREGPNYVPRNARV